MQIPQKVAETKESKKNRLIIYLKQRAEAEKHQAQLSMRFIMEINEGLIEYCGHAFAESQFSSRINRRKVRSMETLAEYAQEVLGSTHAIEQILSSNMDLLLSECGIEMSKFEESNMHWSNLNPQFAMITMLLLDKLKLSVPNTKSCTLEIALEIFDTQIELYPTIQFGANLPSPQLVPMIKQSWLSDLIFEKFGLEEEDYIKAPGLESSMEFRKRAEKLTLLIQADAQQFGMPGMF